MQDDRDKMPPSERGNENEDKREALFNQSCNEVISDLMDRFIEEIVDEDELIL